MEQHRTICTQSEIIEEYCRTFPTEVVETYSCPLPTAMKKASEPEKHQASRRKEHPWLGLIVFLLCLSVLVIGVVAAVQAFQPSLRRQPAWDNYYYELEEQETDEVYMDTYPADAGAAMEVVSAHGEELRAQDIYRLVNPAVVTVMAQIKGETSVSVGTGVIFRQDGYILTNHHVVAGSDRCVILLEGDYVYEAAYVAGDADNDLAILKMDETDLPTVEFGDSDDLVVGDPVYAIGSPLRVEFRGTMTNGIVSAIEKEVDMGDKTMSLIQTNAALNNGNSGGPLINQYGQVVGINVIKMYSRYSTVEGLGFAIPSTYMERVVNDLLEFGEVQPEPVIGISVSVVADRLNEDLWGLEIVDVTKGSAADLAGVRVGDFLLKIDDSETLTSQTVLRTRRKHHLGDTMILTLWRNGETFEAILQLEQSVK